jgi:myosin-1
MDALLACVPHYIRCIKPNDQKKANVLDEQRVRHQVRYLGLLENVRVRRAGFCYRQPYERFIWRYKMISKETWPGTKLNAKEATQTVLNSHKIKSEEYRFGKTKIFLRNPTTLFYLEEQREKFLPRVAILMQSAWRGYVARRQLRRIKAAIMVQKIWKGFKVRREYRTNKEGLLKQKTATKVVYWYRKYKVRTRSYWTF